METYIVTIYAKADHADEVERYYKELQPLYDEATGFVGRKMGLLVERCVGNLSALVFFPLPAKHTR